MFIVTIDFGNVYVGTTNWIEIGARTNGAATFGILSPRQAIKPPPQAVYSSVSGSAASAAVVPASGITGVLPFAVFPGFQSSSNYNVIGGGQNNTNNAAGSGAIAGGLKNTISAGTQGAIGGGYGNIVSGNFATVSGGYFNTASGLAATAAGFSNSAVANGSVIAGGTL